MINEADAWDPIASIKQYLIDELKARGVREEDPPGGPAGFDQGVTWLKLTMHDGSRRWFGVTAEFLKYDASEPKGLRRTLDVAHVRSQVSEAKEPVVLGHRGWLSL